LFASDKRVIELKAAQGAKLVWVPGGAVDPCFAAQVLNYM
jgi:hypothetical protein